MKTKLFLSLCLMAFISTTVLSQTAHQVKSSTETSETTESPSKVKWDSQEYDFGNIPKNIAAEAEFVFTNTSKEPVIISKVKSSCGCTVTGYDKSPVMPGESSTITATYNAKKLGAFRKSLRVTTNDFKPYTLIIKGVVEEDQTIGLK
ncbi:MULTISPECIES: DUF1573 domain-containing protein [unclassified Lentimicrobium]|uniref:DUF1573 domain-containing protein n=1 Tax=unclassified Lentimicrobium TaxID=2677434 RepID=UPI001554C5F3|nr:MULTISPECIES: DUF1573 domain-containing protein [unclassified Lentimicrobium]NPD47093.1 DUF1573 domain-containing protein [Lentimicrobium sp. S6]NPD85741.1 DUF1573 domain-containing protein [Lentimicrobium sp. L6]